VTETIFAGRELFDQIRQICDGQLCASLTDKAHGAGLTASHGRDPERRPGRHYLLDGAQMDVDQLRARAGQLGQQALRGLLVSNCVDHRDDCARSKSYDVIPPLSREGRSGAS